MRTRSADLLRGVTVVAMCAALAASASSSNKPDTQQPSTPPPQQMDPARALGLWKSSFGAVKIEEDTATGPPGSGALHGAWVYQRGGQDVVGYFAGTLNGNVLQFSWQEPATPTPLVGQGYLVFDPSGQQFAGRWWTTARERTGEWSGKRAQAEGQPAGPAPYDDGGTNPYGAGYGGNYGGNPYGGSNYGYGYPPPPPTSPY